MYCGNNAKHPDLLNGTKILGSRYECLNKGKTLGYSQPFDPTFLLPYEPIDKTKKYCGNANILPNEYDRFGGLYECYLKGLGVGKKMKANMFSSQSSYSDDSKSYDSKSYDSKSYDSKSYDISNGIDNMKDIDKFFVHNNYNNKENRLYLVGFIIYLLGLSLFFIGMYYGRPSFITNRKEDNSESKIIDWSKFVPYLLSFSIIYGIFVYFLMKYLINI
jgi:hypothetical protein